MLITDPKKTAIFIEGSAPMSLLEFLSLKVLKRGDDKYRFNRISKLPQFITNQSKFNKERIDVQINTQIHPINTIDLFTIYKSSMSFDCFSLN